MSIGMNKTQQKRFVRELIDSVKKDILQNKFKDIPSNWDGMELRHYVAYRFEQAKMACLDGSRLQNYKNTLSITNL
jgi:hypothetical protein